MNKVLKNLPSSIDQSDLLRALEDSSSMRYPDDYPAKLVAAALGQFSPLALIAERTLLELLFDYGAFAANSIVRATFSAQQEIDYQHIEKMLSDKDVMKRAHAVALLGAEVSEENEEHAIALLQIALQDPSEKIKWIACQAIGRIGEPGYPLIVEILRDRGDDELRDSLVWALVEIQNVRAIMPSMLQELVNIYKDCDSGGRMAILNLLSNVPLQPGLVAPILFCAVRDDNDDVRSTSMFPFSQDLESARPVLDQVLEAFEHEMGRLGQIEVKDPPVDDYDMSPLDDLIEVLGAIGIEAAPALPDLISLLEDPDNYFFGEALDAVCAIATRSEDLERLTDAVEMLLDRNLDNWPPWDAVRPVEIENPIARKRVLEHLVPRFASSLKSASPKKTSALAFCFERIGPAAAIAVADLIASLEKVSVEECRHILSALGEIGERDLSIPVLQNFLDSENDGCREAAAYALSNYQELPETIRPSMQAGLNEWAGEGRINAAATLVANNWDATGNAIQILIRFLSRTDFGLSDHAENRLARIGRPILANLISTFAGGEISVDAVTDTMEKFDPPLATEEVLPIALELLQSDDWKQLWAGLDISRKFLRDVDCDELDHLLWNCFVAHYEDEVFAATDCWLRREDLIRVAAECLYCRREILA